MLDPLRARARVPKLAQLGYSTGAVCGASPCPAPWVSRLGGAPSYYGAHARARPACAACGCPLLLLAQVWAPAGERAERALLLFACNAAGCGDKARSARALRTQAPLARIAAGVAAAEAAATAASAPEASPPLPDAQQQHAADDSTWGAAGAWGADAPAATPLPSPLAAAAPEPGVALDAPPPPAFTPEDAADGAPAAHLPLLGLATCAEPDADHDDDDSGDEAAGGGGEDDAASGGSAGSATAGGEDDAGDGDAGVGDGAAAAGDESWAGERYEALPAGVRFMLNFTERVARLPAQVLRYEWAAEPLWPVPPPALAAGGAAGAPVLPCAIVRAAAAAAAARSGSGGARRRGGGGGGGAARPQRLVVPRCACGGQRRFELQLMPHAIAELGLDAAAASTQALPTGGGGGGGGAGAAAAGAGAGAGAGGARALLAADALDFLTLLVYSCEASCDASQEEFVVAVLDSAGAGGGGA